MYKQNNVGVVIPAAGNSVRMGSPVKKQFLELAGKPIWIHTVEKFHACPEIDSIVVAGPPESIEEMKRQANAMNFHKIRAIVGGGQHRQDSVRSALEVMRTISPDIVLIHDAVRPCISSNLIGDIIDAALIFGAAIPALQPKETVKISHGNSFVDATPNRNTLWLVQTPQGFQSSLLYNAFDQAVQDGFHGTDDASLVERIGVKVKIVPGSYENVKITTPEDVQYAEFLLQNRDS